MKQANLMGLTSDDGGVEAIEGPEVERDWNWKATPDENDQYIIDPQDGKAPPENAGAVFMDYDGVSNTPESNSIKWGIRWLYRKKSKWERDKKTNKACDPKWLSWEDAVERYGPSKPSYKKLVLELYRYGKNPHEGLPAYLWPIKSNGYPTD